MHASMYGHKIISPEATPDSHTSDRYPPAMVSFHLQAAKEQAAKDKAAKEQADKAASAKQADAGAAAAVRLCTSLRDIFHRFP